MVVRHLREQLELLMEHLDREEPNPEFIERHAATIMELAKDLPLPAPRPPIRFHLGSFEYLV